MKKIMKFLCLIGLHDWKLAGIAVEPNPNPGKKEYNWSWQCLRCGMKKIRR